MPGRVLNSNNIPATEIPANTTYIGKGSYWEKDTRIGGDTSRAEALEQHKQDLANDLEKLRRIDELQGMDLLCFCAPRPCHGDILVELATMTYEERLEWAEEIKRNANSA